jgi:hypothetical protein
MIEKDIRDRVPTFPNRVKLIAVPGETDTFTMSRADNPTEEGTPIDRALFQSIIQSRLTGRYYEPTVSRAADTSRSGLTVSPIPTSGWVYETGNQLIATSGAYRVEASSDQNTSADRAADAFTSSGWQSVGGLESWIEIYHAQALRVQKIVFTVEMQYSSRLMRMEIQGSTNGSTWQGLGTYTTVTTNTAMEYTLTNVGDYNYYRLVFTSDGSNRITVKSFRYSLYDVSIYTNSYTLSNMPVNWTKGQRLLIYTPATVNTLAVTKNTLNGVTINTILQNNKRYELRYNGSAFDVKEV